MIIAIKYGSFFIAGFSGMFFHWLKMWTRDETTETLWAYMTKCNPKHSLASVLSFVGAAAAVAMTGQIDTMTLPVAAALGFTTGWTFDSGINKP